jgi:hypothetical protein
MSENITSGTIPQNVTILQHQISQQPGFQIEEIDAWSTNSNFKIEFHGVVSHHIAVGEICGSGLSLRPEPEWRAEQMFYGQPSAQLRTRKDKASLHYDIPVTLVWIVDRHLRKKLVVYR